MEGDSGLSMDSRAGHLHTGGNGSPGQGGCPFRKRFRMTRGHLRTKGWGAGRRPEWEGEDVSTGMEQEEGAVGSPVRDEEGRAKP